MCRAQGDKSYRHPEYDSRFHHAGGLIVGAGFHRGTFKKTEARNAQSIPMKLDTHQMKSYEEKQRERDLQEAEAEVAALTGKKTNAELEETKIVSWEEYALKECESANYEEFDSDEEILDGPAVHNWEAKLQAKANESG